MGISSTTWVVLAAGVVVGLMTLWSRKEKPKLIRPKSAHPRRRRVPTAEDLLTPEGIQSADSDESLMFSPMEEEPSQTWSDDESRNLLSLLYAIAEDKAQLDGVIHRSITCNHCGVSPVRGWRFKCANCVDFDLCTQCESLNVHHPLHNFIKIRIPIPPLANPRSCLCDSFYPGKPWQQSGSMDFSDLEKTTHFDQVEIVGFYEQFRSLSTLETEEGGITQDTFERCLGTLGHTKNIIIDRMFLFFDQNHDGLISFEEMVTGLSVLCKGSLAERTDCKSI